MGQSKKNQLDFHVTYYVVNNKVKIPDWIQHENICIDVATLAPLKIDNLGFSEIYPTIYFDIEELHMISGVRTMRLLPISTGFKIPDRYINVPIFMGLAMANYGVDESHKVTVPLWKNYLFEYNFTYHQIPTDNYRDIEVYHRYILVITK